MNRIIKIIVGIVLVLIIGTLGIAGYVSYSLTHPVRESIDSTPAEVSLKFDDIAFKSRVGDITLRGWWIPAQISSTEAQSSDKTVIFVHGYTSSRLVKAAHALPLAAVLAHHGYNVLMFDLRAAGLSDGSLVTLGQYEQKDVFGAEDFVMKNYHSQHIALLGWSMGAATSIVAGTQAPNVEAIIADSPFADLHTYIDANLSYWSGLPRYPFTPLIFMITRLVFGLHPETVSPEKAIAQLGTRGLLLIHSCKDTAIPCRNSQQIYNAIPDKTHSQLWLTDRGDHVKSYIEYGPVYENKVLAFLKTYLK